MDPTKRCCNCRFYDDGPSECNLNPPVYIGHHKNTDGVVVPTWSNPLIHIEYMEWCGQWQAANESHTTEQRAAEIERVRMSCENLKQLRKNEI